MFGSHLLTVISEFTEDFIPHMEEEEQIFQPLLMKYFAYEELRTLKEQVIQQHEIWKEKLLAQKETAETMLAILETVASEVPEYFQSSEQAAGKLKSLVVVEENLVEEQQTTGFNDLPPEMAIKIFSYLSPFERTKCAQVSKEWNMMIYSPQLWREVYPTNWAKGYDDLEHRDPYLLVEADWKSNVDDDGDDQACSSQAEKEIRFYEK